MPLNYYALRFLYKMEFQQTTVADDVLLLVCMRHMQIANKHIPNPQRMKICNKMSTLTRMRAAQCSSIASTWYYLSVRKLFASSSNFQAIF